MCKLHGVQIFVMFVQWETTLPEAHKIDASKQEHSNIRLSVSVHWTLKYSLWEKEEPGTHLLVVRVSGGKIERVGKWEGKQDKERHFTQYVKNHSFCFSMTLAFSREPIRITLMSVMDLARSPLHMMDLDTFSTACSFILSNIRHVHCPFMCQAVVRGILGTLPPFTNT